MGLYDIDTTDDGNVNTEYNGFTDMDDLIDQWKQYLHAEMQEMKVIKSDMFGKGCVCDLKKIFLSNDTSPEYISSLIPRVNDCHTECLNMEYNRLMSNFLTPFINIRGDPMTATDLGEDEPYFYEEFLNVAKSKTVWNTWDLWTTKKSRPS